MDVKKLVRLMLIILTGGIASGKSTIADLFKKAGADIIDTDIIARQVVEPGKECLQGLIEYFGDEILNKDGTLNRAELKTKIFDNDDDKHFVEALLHPAIRILAYEQVRQSKAELKVIVVPLLKSKQDYAGDRVITIECEPETQIQRVMIRDDITREMAEKIIASQPTPKEREEIADMVFFNDGDLEELGNQIQTGFGKAAES